MNAKFLFTAMGIALQCALLGLPSLAKDKASPAITWETPRLMMPTSGEQALLKWRNGESLAGELEGFSEGYLVWKTPLFADALRLTRGVLDRVDFKSSPTSTEAGFRLTLVDGSHLYGELQGVNEATVTFASTHAGVIEVKRDQVVALERTKIAGNPGGPQVLLKDPAGDNGRNERNGPVPQWMYAAGGRIASPAFNQQLVVKGTLPEKGLLELKFRSDAMPSFAIRSGSGERDTLALETWSDELVLTYGERFVSLGQYFKDNDRGAHFRVCWDHRSGHAAVYDAAGTCLGTLDLPTAIPEKSEDAFKQDLLSELDLDVAPAPLSLAPKSLRDLKIHNKGLGMMIERFQVSTWSGEEPSPLPSNEPYVETDIGVISGEVRGLDGGALLIQRAKGKISKIPVGLVHAMRWPREVHMETDGEGSDLWFSDGQLIRGSLLDGEQLQLACRGTTSPITVKTDDLLAVVFGRSQASDDVVPLEELDTLVNGDEALHGKLEFHGQKLPRFFPVGSASAVKLTDDGKWSVTRSFPEGMSTSGGVALLHFGDNESAPVTLTGIDSDQVEFAWDAVEKKSLSVDTLHAVQFVGAEKSYDVSFAGPNWRSLGESRRPLDRRGGEVVLEPGMGIANPYALQGSDVSFKMGQKSGLGSIRVRLFSGRDDRNPDELAFLFGDYGSSLYCGQESGRDSGQINGNFNVEKNGDELSLIRFVFTDSEVKLTVNGIDCGTAELKVGAGRHMSMIIETASLWGNQVGSVRLADFSNQTSSFAAGTAPFSEDAKREALLLPRLRRDSPPRHVLVGRNGDLLRGTVEALVSNHLAFRTGLESFRVPQERVAAIVWVRPVPSAEDESESKSKSETDKTKQGSRQWLDLINGGRLSIEVESWNDDVIVGHHPQFGSCRIPTSLVYQLRLTSPPRSGALTALADWQLEHTLDPVLPEEEGQDSPMIGKPAEDFTLTMIDDSKFSLADAKGKVVVLDFWATWCGPCVKSLPSLIETMNGFPKEDVAFVAIDQGESKAQVAQFLTARKLEMPVALDGDQQVGRDYGVESIPNTVVIGRDGKICFVKSGFSPDGAQQIADAVREALAKATADS